MDRNILKRGLISCIVFLFLSTSCFPIVSASEGKPDLKIVDIYGYFYFFTGYKSIRVKYTNVGDTPVSGNILISSGLKIKPLILPFTIWEYHTNTSHSEPLYPGKVNQFDILIDFLPLFGIYRCYVELDPDNLIEETNENNNMAWAVFRFYLFLHSPEIIGNVHFSE